MSGDNWGGHLELRPPDWTGTRGGPPWGYWHVERIASDGGSMPYMMVQGKFSEDFVRELATRLAVELEVPLHFKDVIIWRP